jgi:hypothetical protein
MLRSELGLKLIVLLNADNVQIKQNKIRKPTNEARCFKNISVVLFHKMTLSLNFIFETQSFFLT